MDRTFTLPVAFAAALHAALLFGFPKALRVVPPTEPFTKVIPFELALPEPDPVAEAGSGEASESVAPARQIPMSPEPPAVGLREALTMPRPNIEPLSSIDPRAIPTSIGNLFHGDGEGIAGSRIPLVTELDHAPRTRFQPAPVYPFEGRREGLRGDVFVEFTVDETGRVVDPRIVRSSNRIFEEPTLRAVSRWQFEPGRRAGRVVRFKMAVPVIFSLNE